MNSILPIEYLTPILALLAAAVCAGTWQSTRGCRPGVRVPVLVFRLLAVAALAAIAINPGAWRSPVKNENSEWEILVDGTASMATDDAGGMSRWKRAAMLAAQAWKREDLAGRVHVHTFSDRLERDVRKPEELQALPAPDGRRTDILAAVQAVLDRYEGRDGRLAGIILFSDGRQLGPVGPEQELGLRARGMSSPIHAIAIGGKVEQKDLAVSAVRRHYVTFAGQKLTVSARLDNRNLGDIRPTVRLVGGDGREIAARQVALTNQQQAVVDFTFAPAGKPYQTVRIEAAPWPGEAVTQNNAASIGVTILTDKINLLFVEGAPHWDSKFLIQLLRQQPHMQVTTVHRVTGERYFRVESGLKDEAQTQTVFPEDALALSRYDGIAFGKGAEYFLTPERVVALRDFVREKGGCVLFCRGKPYFGSYDELESLEPLAWGEPVARAFRWQPRPAGQQAGLFGSVLPAPEDGVWNRLPELTQATQVSALRPFTQVLAEGASTPSDGRRLPVLASRRAGRGLAVVVNAEGMWRWDFFPAQAEAATLYKQFWVELFQWAVTQAEFLPGQQVALRLTPTSALPGVPVKAVLQVRGDAAAGAEAPTIRVLEGDSAVQTIQPRPSPGAADEWAAVFSLPRPGIYRIEGTVKSKQGEPSASVSLDIRQPPGETEELSADPDFLSRLAQASGGRLATQQEIPAIVASFAPQVQETDASAPEWRTQWDSGWLALAIVGLLGGEWFVRRRNGLL